MNLSGNIEDIKMNLKVLVVKNIKMKNKEKLLKVYNKGGSDYLRNGLNVFKNTPYNEELLLNLFYIRGIYDSILNELQSENTRSTILTKTGKDINEDYIDFFPSKETLEKEKLNKWHQIINESKKINKYNKEILKMYIKN